MKLSFWDRLKIIWYYMWDAMPGLRKYGVKAISYTSRTVTRIFPGRSIRVRKGKVYLDADSGNSAEINVEGAQVIVKGGITLANRIVFMHNYVLHIRKVGDKILSDGSLWIENTIFFGNLGTLSCLNIVAGGTLRGNVRMIGMIYIRDGSFIGDVEEVEKWVHLSDVSGTIKGTIKRIGETLFLDSGTYVTDSLPRIEGGYAVIKDGILARTNGDRWDLSQIIQHIANLKNDQEIFLFGSGGSVLLGPGAHTILFKEGTDTYSRSKTENIISTNRFYILRDGQLKEVRLRISNNQNISIEPGKFYSYVRLDIV
ncbi:MAG: hypothetical protein HQK89_07800 [Nitrospirae bacterium]|nr:hypothetical protein [Nitrospirota bacterium]